MKNRRLTPWVGCRGYNLPLSVEVMPEGVTVRWRRRNHIFLLGMWLALGPVPVVSYALHPEQFHLFKLPLLVIAAVLLLWGFCLLVAGRIVLRSWLLSPSVLISPDTIRLMAGAKECYHFSKAEIAGVHVRTVQTHDDNGGSYPNASIEVKMLNGMAYTLCITDYRPQIDSIMTSMGVYGYPVNV